MKEEVKRQLDRPSPQSPSHRLDHFQRVLKNAIEISKKSRLLDRESLCLAALLHDIDEAADKKNVHVSRSVTKARAILIDLGYPDEKTARVVDLIEQHSSELDILPRSKEARILYDADKIDGLGPIGVARSLVFCGELHMTPSEAIEWYETKIKKAIPRMKSQAGKRIAKKKLAYSLKFIKAFKLETASR